MTSTEYPEENARASVSKRELRNLARRLAPSARAELRAVSRVLDKIASGEACSRAHHDGHDYDPFRCPACLPDLWVMYVIGVAFPNADATDLGFRFAGLLGLSCENIALGVDEGRREGLAPDVAHAWLALTDRQRDEIDTIRAELEPGRWERDHRGHWHECESAKVWNAATLRFEWPHPIDPEVDALIADVKATHGSEIEQFITAQCHGRTRRDGRAFLRTDPALTNEIRFGSDTRKARATQRASLKKGFDSSWLI